MPFTTFSKIFKSKEDVLPEMPGTQTRVEVAEIVLDVIKNRRNVTKYQDRDVAQELIYDLLDAARHAHSEGNQQPWEFIIVRDKFIKQGLAEAALNQSW